MVGDQCPFVPVEIYWLQGRRQCVMALVDTRAEVTSMHGTPSQMGQAIIVNGLSGANDVQAAPTRVRPERKAPPIQVTTLIAPIHEYLLGVDILCGQIINTQ